MTEKTILIIGAGNIGSRHLQGLATLNTSSTIYVVDPYTPSLETCKSRWEQTNGTHTVYFSTEMPVDLKQVDCAIMASTADARAESTKKLIAQANVKNILFEKVLFQDIKDYAFIQSLLKEKSVEAWVNCPRRIWPAYREFAQSIDTPQSVDLHVTGSAWGLGCNGIHMLDYAGFLSGDTSYEIISTDLDETYIPSKRDSFIEFTGSFAGKFSNGTTFRIESLAQENIPFALSVRSANGSIIFHEDAGYYDLSTGEQEERKELSIPYQSALTGHIVQEIFDTGECKLTPFNISVALHTPFIEMLLTHWNKITKKDTTLCPIT